MITGPTLVFKCLECGKKVTRGSLLSGNTGGAVYYSDGKRMASMLPEFPAIVKCKACDLFFWLKDENQINTKHSLFDDDDERENYDRAKFLSASEYNEAIRLRVFKNKKEQIFLRIQLWRAFNDRIRHREDLFLAENDKEIYESNCLKLLELLDVNNIDDKIMIAELFRNLENYEKCKEILSSLDEENNWIKEKLEKECSRNNKFVIKL